MLKLITSKTAQFLAAAFYYLLEFFWEKAKERRTVDHFGPDEDFREDLSRDLDDQLGGMPVDSDGGPPRPDPGG